MDALDRAAFLRQAGTVALLPRFRPTGSRSSSSLPPPLAELQRDIDGSVVARTSPGYTRAHRLYNTRFDAYRPLAVA